VRIVIDGQAFELPTDTDPDALRRRVAQAVFRCEVEQLHLADGRTVLVNWRSVRTIQIELGAHAHPQLRDVPPAVSQPPPGGYPAAP
jgi:hypothetical protein